MEGNVENTKEATNQRNYSFFATNLKQCIGPSTFRISSTSIYGHLLFCLGELVKMHRTEGAQRSTYFCIPLSNNFKECYFFEGKKQRSLHWKENA